MIFNFAKPKERYLTFTFDDGFWQSAQKIDRILDPYKATFYIVTGWVRPNKTPVSDKYNLNADHGSLEDWQDLARKGHDIGSHSVSHANFSEAEYTDSLEFIKKIHPGPYSVAFPHNKVFPIKAPYDTIRVGYSVPMYNSLDIVDLKRVVSWSPWTESMWERRIFWKIGRLPSRSWLVLNLHGLDGEGWHPWKSVSLSRLKDYVLHKGFQIKTMAWMTDYIKKFQRHA